MTNTLLNNNDSESLLKATQVAEILNISKSFVYKLIQLGDLESVKIGSVRRVTPSDLRKFIEIHGSN